MAKLLKLRRGTTTQHGSFTGAEGEVTIDTTKDTAVIHDGQLAGGRPLAREDMTNVPAGTIMGTQLENSGVTAGQYGSSSAIPIVTVDAQGLVTAASTTAIDSTTIANGSSSVSVANNGAITSNANHDFSAGIDVTGNITSTGTIGSSGDITITNDIPRINFVDSGDNPDWEIGNINGAFRFRDTTNSATWMQINTDGHVDINANLDVAAGIDVTSGNITLPDSGEVRLGDSGDLQLYHNGTDSYINDTGTGALRLVTDSLQIRNAANNATRLSVASADGQVNIPNNLDVGAGVDVTGNITVTGTVDGVDIATKDAVYSALTSGSATLNNGVLATTQSASDNSQKVATTAYVTTAIGNAQAFPSGTKMLFQQSSAPTGWTKITSGVENKALRVTSGTAGSGGTNQFTNTFASVGITANAGDTTAAGNVSVANTTVTGNVSIDSVSTSGTVNSHTLTSNEMPSHRHNLTRNNSSNYWNSRNNIDGFNGMPSYSWRAAGSQYGGNGGTAFYTDHTGGGGGHSHGFTGSSHTHSGTLSAAAHTHNASFTGSAHNHSISVNNIDLAVQYLDVIIASKD